MFCILFIVYMSQLLSLVTGVQECEECCVPDISKYSSCFKDCTEQCMPIERCDMLSSSSPLKVSVANDRIGGIASYSCLDDLFLIGNKQRTCMDDKTWSGTEPSCLTNLPTSFEVDGQIVSCAQISLTMMPDNTTQRLDCIDIYVNSNFRFPNGVTCVRAWRSWSSATSWAKRTLAAPTVCDEIGQQLSGVDAVGDLQAFWSCDATKPRAYYFNRIWDFTRTDNGYMKSLRCFLPA